MGKRIIIESDENAEVKRVEKNVNNNKLINNRFLEWLICMIGYALVLLLADRVFKSLYIDTSYFGVYALLAAIIIYALNKTIKPILKIIMLPITIASLGLLYPLSNVIILYITSLILGNRFVITGFFTALVIAVFISILNLIMEGLVVKPIIKRKNSYHG